MNKIVFLLLMILLQPLVTVAGQKHPTRLDYPQIRLEIPASTPEKFRGDLILWTHQAARALESYYDGFPLRSVLITVQINPGRAVHGRAFGFARGRIDLQMGRDVHFPGFPRYWVMTHELIHLAMPNLGDSYSWLMEGISTYVEPIARYQIGELSKQEVIKEWWDNFPKGLPKYDRGLNHDSSWGARYWGGALFCFLADIRLRKESGNRFGIERALRAVAHAADSDGSDWNMDKWLAYTAKATHSKMIESLYKEMAEKPIRIQLQSLWRRLGVQWRSGKLTVVEGAQDAAVLNSIFSKDP